MLDVGLEAQEAAPGGRVRYLIQRCEFEVVVRDGEDIPVLCVHVAGHTGAEGCPLIHDVDTEPEAFPQRHLPCWDGAPVAAFVGESEDLGETHCPAY